MRSIIVSSVILAGLATVANASPIMDVTSQYSVESTVDAAGAPHYWYSKEEPAKRNVDTTDAPHYQYGTEKGSAA
ncbi:uncharacterized protein N7529_003049 [Penicillium soppii]|jgi:hypothetical protein|uniref:uncharacterized protein n=1 Tax=Penicillium soppii TaxID=69789 RepID=UPI002549376F|nr:uncharacterized protein N7529_003049 [Penicillium soppii]KAJ5874619.1 hypothetical protein N7529_003049 [Penicillium soppii]